MTASQIYQAEDTLIKQWSEQKFRRKFELISYSEFISLLQEAIRGWYGINLEFDVKEKPVIPLCFSGSETLNATKLTSEEAPLPPSMKR